jgi:ElaB/YqjD/DUF883 family membrane-anchored ribosome-binding protein
MQDTFQDTLQDTLEAAAPLRETMRSTLGRARERLSDVASRASDTRDVAMRATENYVAASPYMTIAVAAAVGLAIGMLVMSARSSRRSDEVYYP